MATAPLNLLAFLLILSSFTRSHATLVAKEYWSAKLPNTPMPKALRDHLRPRRNLNIPSSEPVSVDAAAKTNPGVGLLSGAKQAIVGDKAEANPVVAVRSDAARRRGGDAGKPIPTTTDQVTVDPTAEANPGVLVLSGSKQVTIDGERGLAVDALILYYPKTEEHKKNTVTAATQAGVNQISATLRSNDYGNARRRGGDAEKPIPTTTDQVTVDPTAEANPGVLVLSGSKQVTIDGEKGLAVDALIAYYPKTEEHKKNSVTAATQAGVNQISATLRSSDDGGDLIDRPTAHSFFLEKDLHRGAKMNFYANRAFSGDYFLPRRVAESIPFSSDRLSELIASFAVRPDSILEERMKETLRLCEMPVPDVEKKRCATSLESMVDFATSVLGTRDVGTVSTEVERRVPGQLYTVDSWSAVPKAGETTVACHALAFPYTVLHCHMTPASRPYSVRLVGEDGAMVEAAVMCHSDTSAWEPTVETLVAFNQKPGGATVCHLLQEGDVLWYARNGSARDGAASA